MQLVLYDDVKEWIRSKGSQATVQLLQVKGCCAPEIQDFVVLPVKPKDTREYVEFNVDNVSIYVYKPISVREKLTLQLKGFGIFRTVFAKVQ